MRAWPVGLIGLLSPLLCEICDHGGRISQLKTGFSGPFQRPSERVHQAVLCTAWRLNIFWVIGPRWEDPSVAIGFPSHWEKSKLWHFLCCQPECHFEQTLLLSAIIILAITMRITIMTVMIVMTITMMMMVMVITVTTLSMTTMMTIMATTTLVTLMVIIIKMISNGLILYAQWNPQPLKPLVCYISLRLILPPCRNYWCRSINKNYIRRVLVVEGTLGR